MDLKGKDAIQVRSERMKQAEGILNALGEIKYIKALAVVSYNLGVSENKAREYIRILRDVGKIVIDNGVVKPYVPDPAEDKKMDELIRGSK